MAINVHDLPSAFVAYHSAQDKRQEQAAYHEILLFGGKDGYSGHGAIRCWLIRLLRRLANKLDSF